MNDPLPAWLQTLNLVLNEALLIGGLVLLVLRIAAAIRSWRRPTASSETR